MTRQDYEIAKIRLGMKDADLAEALQVTTRTLCKYKKDGFPRIAELAIKALEAGIN